MESHDFYVKLSEALWEPFWKLEIVCHGGVVWKSQIIIKSRGTLRSAPKKNWFAFPEVTTLFEHLPGLKNYLYSQTFLFETFLTQWTELRKDFNVNRKWSN